MSPDIQLPATLTLRNYVQVLRRRRGLIIAVALLSSVLAALPTILATPVYSSEADVRVSTLNQEGIFNADSSSTPLPADRAIELATEIENLTSAPTRAAVEARFPDGPPEFEAPIVTQVGFSEIVTIKIHAGDPAVAADVANMYADVFIEDRLDRSVEALLAKTDELKEQSAQAKAELDSIAQQQLDPTLTLGQNSNLQVRQSTLIAQVQDYDRRADELGVEAALRGRGTELNSPAVLELDPIASSPLRSGLVGLVLGLLLGLSLAIVVDTIQDKLASREDLAEVRPSLPVLASVPHTDFQSLTSAEGFAAREAFRYLRTGLRVYGLNSSLRSILVTSAVGAEGKSTTAANLAMVMAETGDRVVLVDCDLRRPTLADRFGITDERGLSSVVIGDSTLEEITHFVHDNLAVVTAGPPVQNPTEVLGSEPFAHVLRSILAQSDFMILDSPPVLPVADALIAGQLVDGALVVSRIGEVRRRAVREALDRLGEAGVDIVGLVANDTLSDEAGYGDYGDYSPAELRTNVPVVSVT